MKPDKKIDRRQWHKVGLGATLGGASASLPGMGPEVSDGACKATKYESVGPFHPRANA